MPDDVDAAYQRLVDGGFTSRLRIDTTPVALPPHRQAVVVLSGAFSGLKSCLGHAVDF
jgi:hypothetical protein